MFGTGQKEERKRGEAQGRREERKETRLPNLGFLSKQMPTNSLLKEGKEQGFLKGENEVVTSTT